MQSILISKKQLYCLMRLLEESLVVFGKKYRKISFYNDWCMYNHIRLLNTRKRRLSVGALLDIMEPYIPFRLTDENFDYFMEAVITADEANVIDPKFAHKAKMDFVLGLNTLKHQRDWEQATAVCEAIRAIKEEIIYSDN